MKSMTKILTLLSEMDWDCFYRGHFYGCYYYWTSGNDKSPEFIGKTLLEVLNKMWDYYNTVQSSKESK